MIQAESERRRADSLFFVFHVDVLCVDHSLVLLLTTPVRAWLGTCTCTWSSARTARLAALGLRRLVHLLGQLMGSLGQSFTRPIHLRLVIRFQRFLGIGHRVLDLATLRTGDFVSVLTQHLLGVLDHAVEL